MMEKKHSHISKWLLMKMESANEVKENYITSQYNER